MIYKSSLYLTIPPMADATSSRYDPVVLVGIAHPMATKSLEVISKPFDDSFWPFL
ncbi:MAG: hypothetical protein JRJ42_08405 [Deltaproteobacteria bacterium]|nr:hypothetical protein [Deltaproteobacteria bacterium]